MSLRIRARAIRRAGELLKQIEPAHGAHWESKRDGTDSSISRTEAARQAGLSTDMDVGGPDILKADEPCLPQGRGLQERLHALS
jgi:hypothetical protein